MIRLLDVNVLVALAWPNHVHHAAAHEWFGAIRDEGWATCSMTETGFVRVSSNPKALPDAVRPVEAIALLQRMRAVPGHQFWKDAVSIADDGTQLANRIVGHRQVADVHLVLLAQKHGGRLATFDRGIVALASGILPESVEHLAG